MKSKYILLIKSISISLLLGSIGFSVYASATEPNKAIDSGKTTIEKISETTVQFISIEETADSKRYVYSDSNYRYETDANNNILRIQMLPDFANNHATTRSSISTTEAKQLAENYVLNCIGNVVEGELEYNIANRSTGGYQVDILEKIDGIETGTSCGIVLEEDGTLVIARFTLGSPQMIRDLDKSSLLSKKSAINIALSEVKTKESNIQESAITAEMHTFKGTIYWLVTVPINNETKTNYYVKINALTNTIIEVAKDL